MRLKNTTTIVTGAAHRVGKGIAIELASHGSNIVLHYNSSDEQAIATELELKEFGVEVNRYKCDLSNGHDIKQMIHNIGENVGQVNQLVNSASMFKKQPFSEVTLDDWNKVMNVNLRAPFLLIKYVSELMIKNEGVDKGSIVNIADLSGVNAWYGYSHHGVSKAGLIHLTKVTARELAPHIRVNCIVPGPILEPAGSQMDSSGWTNLISKLPLERTGGPKSIGETVRFLFSNDFITGAKIHVDGGESLIGSVIYRRD
ncbi:MAG: SDR family oxidoreductase [Candidatus Heimdallarchaeota archaeon]|nr:SDR family oxidoreductase [Candidatus Heimdallarchaeota archaeon]